METLGTGAQGSKGKGEVQGKERRGHCENCGTDVKLVERKRIEEFKVVGTEWICPFCGKAIVAAVGNSEADSSKGSSSKGISKGLGALFGEDAQGDQKRREIGIGSLFAGERKQDNGRDAREAGALFLTDASDVHCCRECFHCTFNLYHCHCCYYNKDVDPFDDCPQFRERGDKRKREN